MKLENWLVQEGKRPTEFARDLGVNPATITRLLPGDDKKQTRRPGRTLMAKIMAHTKGQVTANDYADATDDLPDDNGEHGDDPSAANCDAAEGVAEAPHAA